MVQRYHVRPRVPVENKGGMRVVRFKDGKAVFVNLRNLPKGLDDKDFKIKIKLIRVDDVEMLEEPRFKNRRKIDEYKMSGSIRKPVSVHGKYHPGQKYQLWDGHHRFIAAKERGDVFIPAVVDLNRFNLKEWRRRNNYEA